MNRSKIEWCDYTFNPITGCRHGCPYCYARLIANRFAGDIRLNKMAKADYTVEEAPDGSGPLYILDKPMKDKVGKIVYPFGHEPTYHRYRINMLDKLKKGNNIFVGAMADIFGEWVPDKWLDDVFGKCEKLPEQNFLFLTKNVDRYCKYGVPAGKDNFWYGTSITRQEEMSRFNSLPAGCKRFISFEPILEDLRPEKHNILFRQVSWIIIGAETGQRQGKAIPELRWVENIVKEADTAGVPVFMKDSLVPVVGEKNMRREYPEELNHRTAQDGKSIE